MSCLMNKNREKQEGIEGQNWLEDKADGDRD
jgi:hypothetical protein